MLQTRFHKLATLVPTALCAALVTLAGPTASAQPDSNRDRDRQNQNDRDYQSQTDSDRDSQSRDNDGRQNIRFSDDRMNDRQDRANDRQDRTNDESRMDNRDRRENRSKDNRPQSNSDQPAGLGVSVVNAQQGVSVRQVSQNSPAREAGIQVGDEILAVNGRRITTAEELVRVVKEQEPGTNGTVVLGSARSLACDKAANFCKIAA